MGAREAQEEINKRSIEDEVIVDERPRSNTRQMITRLVQQKHNVEFTNDQKVGRGGKM